MNTKHSTEQKSRRQGTRQKQEPKKLGRKAITSHGEPKFHEHERIESRMYR